MTTDVVQLLRECSIHPSAQRVAVAEYVLATDEHPNADQVCARVRERFPMISRATIYNTLNLFVEKGLLQQLQLTPGRMVFDPNTDDHHHLIDDETGEIYDIPWEALEVKHAASLKGFAIDGYQVVLRGRKA